MKLDDSWVGIDFVTDDEIPGLVRYRPNLQDFIESGLYPRRMDIIWTYESFDDSLLPTQKDMDLMASVEDALVDAFEGDNQTILAFVFTCDNERWWAFYTTDINMAGQRLNEALAIFDPLPIDISVDDDPNWDEYFGVIEDFGGE
ncbi:DUF695 domain-containing protein [Mucilaginibacter sp. SG564]|uniref:DUF695 domain-containing protein n=1 Tax=unclassified Mucilaginibacter TaxID=2617802 RepID=UPI0015541AD5|nr:DUF695 domain-containing protein [Mucilaginibacter sp. SG564]NOW95692.1 hypothetical protein [Mucilaginibacter sp. SG564]